MNDQLLLAWFAAQAHAAMLGSVALPAEDALEGAATGDDSAVGQAQVAEEATLGLLGRLRFGVGAGSRPLLT